MIIIFIISMYLFCAYVAGPRKELLKSYESETMTVNVYSNTIRLIGDFSSKNIFALPKDGFFESKILLYSTEFLDRDSLSVAFEGNNIIRINSFVNDTIIQDESCIYNLDKDTEPCLFYLSGNSVQH